MILLTGIMTTVSIITFVKSFDDSFGNGRGIIWRMSTDIFMGLSPWQKMVGVGQDCLYPYAMRDAFWSSSFSNVFGQDMLTNAHCELLTLLIDRGLIGATTYLGLFFSVLLNLFNAKEKEPAAIICALPLFSYFVFNQTSFAQVMSTPYFFLLIGIAMAITEGRLSGQVGNLD